MHMNVHSVLSGGSPNIDADVVAVRRMICGNLRLRTIEKRLYFGLLLDGHVKIACDVSARNHQNMARAQAIVIVPNIRERAFKQKVLGSAQLAIFSRHGINPIWTVSPVASPIPGEDFYLKLACKLCRPGS